MIIKLKVFNSDIILGKYDKEINTQFASKLAQAIFSLYQDDHLTFVVGKDTKQENYELEKTLAQVLSNLGANVFLLGTTTTGAVSFATRAYKTTAGIMITGSSKPKGFVGFKIFNGNGFKISDEQIETLKYKFKNISELSAKQSNGKIYFKPYFNFEYINFLKQFSRIPKNNSVKILADISCGSGEEVYEELVLAMGVKSFLSPAGYDCENINLNYQRAVSFEKTNSFKTEDIFGKVKNHSNFFDFKVVFDADCDKLVLFDRNGKRIYSEQLLMLFALDKKKKEKNSKVVVGGFVNSKTLQFFEEFEIEYVVVEDSVKQKTLVHTALKEQVDLLGDCFGNIVFLDKAKTADAFLTLIEFLNIYVESPELVRQVFDYELNKKYIKKVKVNSTFDIEKFKEALQVCDASLFEEGKIKALFNKYMMLVEVHLETNDEGLKDDIFVYLQKYFF